ncbi:MAG: nucleotide exchange factor GrpE [bacterium]|nr:nucleotide exchange factor GrpE [bacterium]
MTKKSDIEKLEQEIIELTDALQRERADATNVRRRADEDRIKMGAYYKSSVVRELLPVIDNFERALKHVPKDLENNEYIKGIEGVVKQFEDTLAKLGVNRIKTVGESFDPNLHEAVSHEEGEGQEIVSEELQSGYTLGDEVLRHAMVRVKS